MTFDSACTAGSVATTVELKHHMYGATMGELRIVDAADQTRWSRSGDQGDSWQSVSVDIYSASFSIEYVRGSGFTGDAAFDQVVVYCGHAPPPSPPSPPPPP